jgi:hypothetical protein
LERDTAKNKKSIISTAGYLASYYANIVKDKVKAIELLKKMLVFDPTNETIQKNLKILEGGPATKPAVPPRGNAPPPAKVTTKKPATGATIKPKTKPVAKTTASKK